VNLYTGYITDIGSGEKDTGQYGEPRYVAACGGFAFLTRARMFRELGGLADEFNPYGWEDVDFAFRALRRGHRCYYTPKAVVWHKGCKIGRGYVPLYEKYKVKHYFLFLSRHANRLQKLTCAVVIPFRLAWLVVKMIARGNGRILFSQLSGALENFLGRRRSKPPGEAVR
jgi:GT2 family glycosyltransferase